HKRYTRGDGYPAGSSYRTDPLGTRALHDALAELDGVTLRRHIGPASGLTGGPVWEAHFAARDAAPVSPDPCHEGLVDSHGRGQGVGRRGDGPGVRTRRRHSSDKDGEVERRTGRGGGTQRGKQERSGERKAGGGEENGGGKDRGRREAGPRRDAAAAGKREG